MTHEYSDARTKRSNAASAHRSIAPPLDCFNVRRPQRRAAPANRDVMASVAHGTPVPLEHGTNATREICAQNEITPHFHIMLFLQRYSGLRGSIATLEHGTKGTSGVSTEILNADQHGYKRNLEHGTNGPRNQRFRGPRFHWFTDASVPDRNALPSTCRAARTLRRTYDSLLRQITNPLFQCLDAARLSCSAAMPIHGCHVSANSCVRSPMLSRIIDPALRDRTDPMKPCGTASLLHWISGPSDHYRAGPWKP
jgi:hypothetical protein